MSEATVSYDEVSTPSNTNGVTDSGQLREALDFRVRQVLDLEARVAELEAKSAEKLIELTSRVSEAEFQARNSVRKNIAKDAALDLVGELTGETDIPDSLDDEQLRAVNDYLESIGVDTFKKTFRITVEGTEFRSTDSVTIEIEADSFESATDEIENGDHDDEILSGLNLEYGNVEITSHGEFTDEDA